MNGTSGKWRAASSKEADSFKRDPNWSDRLGTGVEKFATSGKFPSRFFEFGPTCTLSPVNPELTFLIPAFNEEQRIRASLSQLTRFHSSGALPFEILLVDDGSQDRTAEIVSRTIRSTRDSLPLRLVSQSHRGKGAALRLGSGHISTPCTLWVDADLPYSLDFVAEALKGLRSGAVAVIGARDLPGAELPAGFSLTRRTAGKILGRYVNLLLPLKIYDTQCGIKAFRTEWLQAGLEHCREERFALDIELLLILRLWHQEIRRIPVRLLHSSGSRIRLTRDGLQIIRDTLAIRRRWLRQQYPLEPPPLPLTS